ARETGLQAIAAAEACGDIACQAEAHSMLGLLLGMQGDTVGGRARLEHALDLSLRHNLTASAAEAYRLLGTVAEYASCYGDQQTAFARALAYCRRHDATTTSELCMGCLSYSLFRSGNWTRSRRVALGVLERPGVIAHCVAEAVLGLYHAHRGELRVAVPHLESSRAIAHRIGLLCVEFFYSWGIALVEQQAGRPDSAAVHYRRLLDFWSGTEDRHDAIPGLTFGALFFCDQGDTRTAGDFAAALRVITTATANPEAAGAHALVSGELLRREGKPAQALPLLRRALESYAHRELVVERIHTLPRLAAALLATGDTSSADATVREASQRAGRLGMRALLPSCEARSLASAPTDAWSVLSPRQRDVARQIATGATNKEIAARLGLGVRTIDMHVGHVLARLDCRSRAEAATRITSLLA
ncbi:MAG: helix-turn-helix transcriptional regulator, partial [Opitutaceae bacterium]|nr:helix-turn-helix transcriptional regulator [Opitutaceae bacterium]